VTIVLGDKADDACTARTILTRKYKGSVVQVQILANGFEFRGRGVQVAQRGGQGDPRGRTAMATLSFRLGQEVVR